jgi:Flp pilus assembly protein protease CpaA
MEQPFFPNLPFAVVYVTLLLGGLACAAWTDWKTLFVPKWLSLSILAAGVLANTVRGGWLGATGQPTWLLSAHPALGAVDGFLFAIAGFMCGFLMFFLFWIFGICGGGDVKLVAAVGTWLGPRFILGGIVLSTPFLILLVIGAMTYRILTGRMSQLAARPADARGLGRRRRVTSYSLPFALGVCVILGLLLWGYQHYLQEAAAAQV